MKIYTKTGDHGETGLVGGQRVIKASKRIAAIGDVDELNACLGLARAESPREDIDQALEWLQSALFDIGAELASPPGGRIGYSPLASNATALLEEDIDRLTSELPPLKNFILPGGSKPAAQLHHARCVCRRAERSVLELHQQQALRPEVLAFLNRLSDWLFVSARASNRHAGIEDVPWRPSQASG